MYRVFLGLIHFIEGCHLAVFYICTPPPLPCGKFQELRFVGKEGNNPLMQQYLKTINKNKNYGNNFKIAKQIISLLTLCMQYKQNLGNILTVAIRNYLRVQGNHKNDVTQQG